MACRNRACVRPLKGGKTPSGAQGRTIGMDEGAIFEFLEGELGVDLSGFDADSPLFSSGAVDSFALVTLMMFLEREGGFRIAPADVTLDNLDSVNKMLAFAGRMHA